MRVTNCRVLKRGVEKFVLNEVVNLALGAGCKTISGEYLPTAKNGIVKEHYLQLGFEKKEDIYILDAGEYIAKKIFIKREN